MRMHESEVAVRRICPPPSSALPSISSMSELPQKIIIKPSVEKPVVVAFGKILQIRSALLLVIAFCIAVVVESEDRNVRLLAAVAAIVVEIIRDAVLASGIGSSPRGKEW